MINIHENKFYQALESIFTGVEIEGDSGYVNLLKIKSNYYKLILNEFKKSVDNEEIITDSFKEEFFDKLYSFFEKYFSESGSVYFVKTANWQRVYEKVYTDNKDVVLFWKTHMLYYVKSDILFKSIDVVITDEENKKDYHFYFDVGNLQAKRNNERRSLIFTFREIKEEKDNVDIINGKQGKKIFVFDVSYSEKGNKTKIDDIIKATKIPEFILEKAFSTFKKQSEVDFFINKNAEKFLTEQLDMYLHQILLSEENKFEQKRLDQLKTIKTFALKIIKFIAQFEDELVRIWNKPKFVLNSNYVITLDRISNTDLINRILNHHNIQEQIKEWQELGIVEENFKVEDIFEIDLLGKQISKKYNHLPIDTKYFKDLEIDILSLFENIDEALDGRLIHSENYQALNTLKEKYKEKIQCIYIDPPFNLDSSDQFLYRTNYKDANWATLLENRLRIAREWLNDKGSIFVRCDYNGNWIVRCLMDDVFGKENFRNNIIIKRYTGLPKTGGVKFEEDCEYLSYFSKNNEKCLFNQFFIDIKPRWMNLSTRPSSNEENKPIIIEGKEFFPPKYQRWALSQETVLELCKSGRGKIENNKIKILIDKSILGTNWTDISGYSINTGFKTENAEILLKRVIESTSSKGDLVMDFFLGSGTTTAVAHKLGRKWIGVEMGEHFYTVVLPRMKKVLAYDKSGISKEVKEYQGGGFFKYYKLEQYEDTLRNMKYKNNSPTSIFDNKKAFEQYIFYADQKFAHVLEVEKDNLNINFDKLYLNIDFAETISNLLGLPIKRITKTSVILQDKENEKEIKTDYKNMSDSEKLAFLQILKPALWWGE